MFTIPELLIVACGGAIGASGRFAVGRLLAGIGGFPWGTLTVNAIGCLLMGLVAAAVMSRPWAPAWSGLFVMTGLLGGFTTFSAFGLETLVLAQDGRLGIALLNIMLNVAVSLLAVYCGLTLGRWLGG